MFLTVHAAVGAACGMAVNKPEVAFAMGVISHFFLDMVPHGDDGLYESFKRGEKRVFALAYVGTDFVVSGLFVAAFFVMHGHAATWADAAGIAGGILPDILVGAYEVMRGKSRQKWAGRQLARFHRFHRKNHQAIIKRLKNGDIPLWAGMTMQGSVLAGLIPFMLK